MGSGTRMEKRQLFDAKDGVEGDEAVAEWFKDLAGINTKFDQQRIGRFKRVKIAILDTGIDMTNDIFNNPTARERIKQREDFLREDPARTDAHDKCGHGSHCAGLLRRVAPAAGIYIARVAKDFDTEIDPQVVTKAIKRACSPKNEDGWDVDIITISFGFSIESDPIAEALHLAFSYNKVIFAAASNNGSREMIAFPARFCGVICVNSASADGRASPFNPVADFPNNFAVLGENVRSAWISPQPNAARHGETKIMSGTSMASPIAAAIFSLLLEVALNPAGDKARCILGYYQSKMRKSDAVQTMLKKASDNRGEYMVINLRFLKNVDDRLEVACWIKDALCERYGKPPDVLESQQAPRAATVPPAQQKIRPPPPKPLPFYTLTSKNHHIREANSYWLHLTLDTYEVYERIYEDCKDPGSGWVYYASFARQFTGTMPGPSLVESMWATLLRDKGNITGSKHPKGLAMAVLYMLHLKRFRPELKPLDEERRVGISEGQRSRLEGFGNWVGCLCKPDLQCAVRWNFVSGRGLHRGGKPKSCLLAKFIDSDGKVGIFESGKIERALLKRARQDWRDSLNT
ncbi:hypothetical protein MAPG_12079 [Magnaporthiopsis poae ATCC 64411]|uniref:Peptidase S8/S53 domain-containing protein n=1 Tax=Magnaporthiopsis poae (strain ATCC 64411 / 73-15) TaxID=644358 RepID=A0A0C4EGS9_MAGP6|nr:hypothetical protein MAPG_12079 [Magnaporthiopsis poae ATCC 64411]